MNDWSEWSLGKTKTNQKVLITPLISLKAGEKVNELGVHNYMGRSIFRVNRDLSLGFEA